jgi:hypothetical protein
MGQESNRYFQTTDIAVNNSVVAHFLDGRMVKGTSFDVDPGKATCHIRPPNEKPLEVRLEQLKALFFVRSLQGNPGRAEARVPDPRDPRARGATVVSLKFADGETMVGMTIRYPPNKPYFYLNPVDPKSNNIRILVNRSAVTGMELLQRP